MIGALPRRRDRLHRRRSKRHKVTIAAGFRFDDGILLCADTKITTDIQTNESKLAFRDYGNGDCVTAFAFADDVVFARAAIFDCEAAVARLGGYSSLESVKQAIQSALVAFYQTHIYPRPADWQERNFQLLIGIWLDGQMCLLSSDETTLTAIETYECLGAGDYLAKYWIRQFYEAHRPDPDLMPIFLPTLEEAGLIASCALKSVTTYDNLCGGDGEFIVIRADGHVGRHVQASMYEEYPTKVQAAMWRMLASLVHATQWTQASPIIDAFFKEIRQLTESYNWQFELGRSLRASVSPSASPSQSPSASTSPSASSSASASPSDEGPEED